MFGQWETGQGIVLEQKKFNPPLVLLSGLAALLMIALRRWLARLIAVSPGFDRTLHFRHAGIAVAEKPALVGWQRFRPRTTSGRVVW